MVEIEKKEFLVRNQGVNGNTTFSIFYFWKTPICTNKPVELAVEAFIGQYPKICEKIWEIYKKESSFEEYPSNVDFDKISYGAKNILIKEIASQLNNPQEAKINNNKKRKELKEFEEKLQKVKKEEEKLQKKDEEKKSPQILKKHTISK